MQTNKINSAQMYQCDANVATLNRKWNKGLIVSDRQGREGI